MTAVATRLLSMIFLFQSRRRWTVAELADQLNVSERTVHRYIGMLEEMGIPLYSERGPYGGFSLLRTYNLPPLIFTPEEATVLYMGAQLVQDIFGKSFHDAITGVTAKLDNVLPDDIRQTTERTRRTLVVTTCPSRDYSPYQDIMTTLRNCMSDGLRIRLHYHSFSRIETDRKVDPYALSFRWGNWYLVGFCHLRDELRTFRIDRIRHLEVISERFELPPHFDAKTYMEETMRWDSRYAITVRMAAEAAPRMREMADDWMQVIDQPDDTVIVRFETDNLDWAAGWVLSWGNLAEVLEPRELIDRVISDARELLQVYAKN